jgi:hypothetical protein
VAGLALPVFLRSERLFVLNILHSPQLAPKIINRESPRERIPAVGEDREIRVRDRQRQRKDSPHDNEFPRLVFGCECASEMCGGQVGVEVTDLVAD